MKFLEGFAGRQTPEEGQIVCQLKRDAHNRKAENISVSFYLNFSEDDSSLFTLFTFGQYLYFCYGNVSVRRTMA